MKLPLPEIDEYRILRALLIDGRVQAFVRRNTCEAAKRDALEVRTACAHAVDAIYGAIPAMLEDGEDVSFAMASMRRQTKADGQNEVLQ